MLNEELPVPLIEGFAFVRSGITPGLGRSASLKRSMDADARVGLPGPAPESWRGAGESTCLCGEGEGLAPR